MCESFESVLLLYISVGDIFRVHLVQDVWLILKHESVLLLKICTLAFSITFDKIVDEDSAASILFCRSFERLFRLRRLFRSFFRKRRRSVEHFSHFVDWATLFEKFMSSIMLFSLQKADVLILTLLL